MNSRRRSAVAIVGGLALAAAPLAASAQETVTEPPPPGEASATAAAVDEVIEVAKTEAEADSDSGSASGSALELGGNPPSEEFGGTQEGEGSSSGALVDVGEEGVGRIAVTPWSATVEEGEDQRAATGEASVAEVTLGDEETFHAKVLHSRSHATHTDTQSTGSASTDGAVLRLGGEEGLHLVVLHSEASTESGGTTYLLSINGNQVFSNDQVGDACEIEIPGALRIICLSVQGGEQTVETVAGRAVLGEEDLVAGLFVATATGSAAPTPDGDGDGDGDDDGDGVLPSPQDTTVAVLPAQVEAGERDRGAPGEAVRGQLAATGFGAGHWLALAFGLMVTGGAMRMGARRADLRA